MPHACERIAGVTGAPVRWLPAHFPLCAFTPEHGSHSPAPSRLLARNGSLPRCIRAGLGYDSLTVPSRVEQRPGSGARSRRRNTASACFSSHPKWRSRWKRIDAGRYGECESRHGEIGSTRLGLEPTARFCKRCSVKRAAADSPFEDFPLKTMLNIPCRKASETARRTRMQQIRTKIATLSGGSYKWKRFTRLQLQGGTKRPREKAERKRLHPKGPDSGARLGIRFSRQEAKDFEGLHFFATFLTL